MPTSRGALVVPTRIFCGFGIVRIFFVLVPVLVLVVVGTAAMAGAELFAQSPSAADKAADKWVDDTMRKMTVDDKVGQLIVPAIDSTYLSTDSADFDRLARDVTTLHVGGFHVFGGVEAVPAVLLDHGYGGTTLGTPLDAASLLNRLQMLSPLPLLNTADFEAGVGFRIQGATVFPRQMAVGAAGNLALATEAARITAVEARAIGVHVNFSPLADVNNNPRNPVINTRSFGETPASVGALAAAYVTGLHAGGMLATLKHFPGHGDTDVDSHLNLPIIRQPRARLDAVELPPFKAGLDAGADAVMTAHIELPSLDDGEFSPASLSQPIVTGLLRGDLKFSGLVYTDSMSMEAIAAKLAPGEAAVRAIEAGNDVVLHSPDDDAAVAAIKAAIASGRIPIARIDASVRRLLRAKARLGLQKQKTVSLDDLPRLVGGRQHAAVAEALSAKSMTLLRDDRNQVPLRVPRTSSVLYLSVLDYPSGWRIASPSRTMIPALQAHWPNLTAVELSDRSTASEIELVRASASRYDAIVVAVFVRAASGSGRMDLAPPLTQLLATLAAMTARSPTPLITVLFGNPYVLQALPTMPAVLLTYDFYDLAESSAARAIVGDAPISGRLPIAIPGQFDVGFGLVR
jgi:beta-glucosidase-like glycosyl hydrolase